MSFITEHDVFLPNKSQWHRRGGKRDESYSWIDAKVFSTKRDGHERNQKEEPVGTVMQSVLRQRDALYVKHEKYREKVCLQIGKEVACDEDQDIVILSKDRDCNWIQQPSCRGVQNTSHRVADSFASYLPSEIHVSASIKRGNRDSY